MNVKAKIRSISFAEWVLFAALFCVGVFHVYLSCLLAIVLLVYLVVCHIRKGSLTVQMDMTFLALLVLVGGYAVTPLWAVDKGTAVFGFFKFFPVLLYAVVLMQTPHAKEQVLRRLPYAVTVMTVLSVFCMHLPFFSSYFAVAGRLGGFVQYPNTFALILLVSELLLITKTSPRVWDYVCVATLLFGILYTGSRTVFVLTVVADVVALLLHKNRKVRWTTLGCIGVGATLILLFGWMFGQLDVLARYLTISATESTFVGRLLYAQDALPEVLRHPFGLGYMGYYFIQQSIQSGVYAVMHVHNEWLQILLDVGWIPCLMLLAATIYSLLHRESPLRYKLILITMLLHACLDFDWQYIAVAMMLLLFMTPPVWKTVIIEKRAAISATISTVMALLCVYFGTAQGLTRFELHHAATALYPPNTVSEIGLLTSTDDTVDAAEIADRILARNPHVSVAYSVKARRAYAQGMFAKVIEYKTKTIQAAPFAYPEYVEYGYMLANGITLYTQVGDTASAAICRKELLALPHAVAEQSKRLSALGRKIDDQPTLTLPEDLTARIQAEEANI